MVRIPPGSQGLRGKVTGAGYRQEATEDDWTAVLSELGMVAVPTKPSMEQIVAATTAAGVTVDEAWRVYAAMLGAAEDIPKG